MQLSVQFYGMLAKARIMCPVSALCASSSYYLQLLMAFLPRGSVQMVPPLTLTLTHH